MGSSTPPGRKKDPAATSRTYNLADDVALRLMAFAEREYHDVPLDRENGLFFKDARGEEKYSFLMAIQTRKDYSGLLENKGGPTEYRRLVRRSLKEEFSGWSGDKCE